MFDKIEATPAHDRNWLLLSTADRSTLYDKWTGHQVAIVVGDEGSAALLNDLRHAVRGFAKRPGFTAVAVLTLALGIGATSAIFSVVDAVLLRPLPYAAGGRLVLVWGELRARNVLDFPFSPPDFRDLKQHATAFEDLAAVTPAGRAPIGDDGGQPEQIRAAGATTNAFALLGARVLFGRDFVPADGVPPPPAAAGAPPPPPTTIAAILSYEFWQRRYGADQSIVGKTIAFGGNGRAQIIGVLEPGFEILFPPRANMTTRPDLWTPLRINFDTANRNNVFMRAIGRLKPTSSLQEAQGQVDAIAADWRARYPIANTSNHHARVVPMHEDLVGDIRPAILALSGAVLFVLLIACANVANLLVVRASARHREIAVRVAIGGSGWRIARQLLAESLVLAGLGAVAGLALAVGAVRALLAMGPEAMPRLTHIAVNTRVLAFTMGASLTAALLSGLMPAIRATRPNLMDVLRQSAGASGLTVRRRLSSAVVVAEIALAFVLLVGASLMVRSFVNILGVNPGFDPHGVLTFVMPPRGQQPAERAQFVRQVQARLHAIPGVTNVTAGNVLPLDGTVANGRLGPESALADQSLYRQARFAAVMPEYFETLRTRLVAGRTFTEDDVKSARKIIVLDDKAAARLFPNQSAIGKRVASRVTTPEAELFEVVGVVAHQRHESMAADGMDGMYFTDGYFGGGAVGRWAVRTTGDASALTQEVRAAVAEIDPRATLAELQPMSALVDQAMAPMRFSLSLITLFAIVAGVMVAVGLYGVVSTAVRQRTAELGVRIVFGATGSEIARLVVGEGLRLSAVGVIIGAVMALSVTPLVRSLFTNVSTSDPGMFLGTSAVFLVVTVLACWIPARRAAQLDPNVALRVE